MTEKSIPTTVVSTRLPFEIKIKLIERAMKYRLSISEYLTWITVKVLENESLLNPENQQSDSSGIAELKEQLKTAEATHRAEMVAANKTYETLVKSVGDQAEKTITELNVRMKELKFANEQQTRLYKKKIG